jgi:hypothetical protein
MTAAVLLCLAALAADDPSAVRAKVIYATGPSDEQRSDIELWISQTVAKNGSPLAEPYTGWIALTGDEQRPFMGWFFINGKASAGNGKPIKLDAQVKHYQDYWKAAEEDRKKQEKPEHESPATPE